MRDNNISENTDPERDIFSDPALGREASDPVADFIKRQWRTLLVLIVLAFALVYVRDTFRESQQRGAQEGANALFESQEAFKRFRETSRKIGELKAKKELSDSEKKELEAAEAELKTRNERIQQTVIILSESVDPYKKFAPIFSALVAHEKGDMAAVNKALTEYSPEKLDELKGNDRMIGELALLALARSLLDFPEGQDRARQILVALAQKGETAGVSAVLTLRHIAVTEQDRQQADEIAAVLVQKYPEQATVLKE